GRPDNVIFYATSNRRHLMPREMMENERSTAINPGEAVEERVSLSDRFGLWLGFHRCSQDEYLAMVEGYVRHFTIPVAPDDMRREALEWATTRGSRSGRVAWQYVQDLAGRPRGPVREPAAPTRSAPGGRRGADPGRRGTGPMVGHDLFRKPVPTFRDHALDQLPLRYCVGSIGVEPLRISKWSCGEVTLPVWPASATI